MFGLISKLEVLTCGVRFFAKVVLFTLHTLPECFDQVGRTHCEVRDQVCVSLKVMDAAIRFRVHLYFFRVPLLCALLFPKVFPDLCQGSAILRDNAIKLNNMTNFSYLWISPSTSGPSSLGGTNLFLPESYDWSRTYVAA